MAQEFPKVKHYLCFWTKGQVTPGLEFQAHAEPAGTKITLWCIKVGEELPSCTFRGILYEVFVFISQDGVKSDQGVHGSFSTRCVMNYMTCKEILVGKPY
jgi:hypothetical protein